MLVFDDNFLFILTPVNFFMF